MKRFLQLWLWFVITVATHGATLNYNSGDFTLNPTNVLFSNLVSTAQITWSMGQSGRITGTITFPTVFDENWTNEATVLHPITAPNVSVSNLFAGGVLVTNTSTFLGLVTNHATVRGTNIFDGGWLRVVGEQTNDAGLTLSARTASSILRTDANKSVAEVTVGSGLSFDGTILSATGNAASTNLDNLTVTNVTKLMGETIATNIFDGGWLEVVGPQTNRGKVDIAGKVTAAEITVTNAAEFFGLMTNHQIWRGTNTFNGGWSEVTGHQTNRADFYAAGGAFINNARITNGLNVSGTIGALILRVTNETTHLGLVTNHTTLQATNIFDGGFLHVTGNQTNAGTLRVTNGIVVPSAGGLTLGTGGTVTNMLFGSAALNFPSTGASAKADLSITVTGTVEGDEAFVGVPATAAQVTGNFTWYTSNDTVWVRFFSGAAAQNPANATFKATVFKR